MKELWAQQHVLSASHEMRSTRLLMFAVLIWSSLSISKFKSRAQQFGQQLKSLQAQTTLPYPETWHAPVTTKTHYNRRRVFNLVKRPRLIELWIADRPLFEINDPELSSILLVTKAAKPGDSRWVGFGLHAFLIKSSTIICQLEENNNESIKMFLVQDLY